MGSQCERPLSHVAPHCMYAVMYQAIAWGLHSLWIQWVFVDQLLRARCHSRLRRCDCEQDREGFCSSGPYILMCSTATNNKCNLLMLSAQENRQCVLISNYRNYFNGRAPEIQFPHPKNEEVQVVKGDFPMSHTVRTYTSTEEACFYTILENSTDCRPHSLPLSGPTSHLSTTENN